MKIKKHALMIIITLSILLIVSVISFAYYMNLKEVPITITTGDIETKIYVSFNGTSGNSYYNSSTKLLTVEVSDSSKVNYVEKLKIKVDVKTTFSSRFRIRILDEWQLVRTYYDENINDRIEVISHEEYPFTISSGFDYILEDKVIYYQNVLMPNVSYSFDIITGGQSKVARQTSIYYETITLKLAIFVDVVQSNRYSELWDIPVDFFN